MNKPNINFYNVDCIEFLKSKPDKYYDLAIVDTPYGIKEDGRKTKGRTFRKDGSFRFSIDKRNGRKALIYNEYKSGNWDNNYPSQDYFDELFRVSKKHLIFGENYIQFDQKKTSSGRIFWDKINGDNDFSDGEMIWTNLFTSVRKVEFMWNGMLQGSNSNGKIMEGNISKREKRRHPTQKPVQLYRIMLNRYATKGMKLLDTHGGSFNHAIAAEIEGFDLDIMDIDKEYFDKGIEAFNIHKMQKRLF